VLVSDVVCLVVMVLVVGAGTGVCAGWWHRVGGSSVGNARSRFEMCIQFWLGACSASFVAPGWSRLMACSMASCDRMNGSCSRWQVASAHCLQKIRQKQVSFGMPMAFMSAMIFCSPAQSTWVRGVPGTFSRRVCCSLYRVSGRQFVLGVCFTTFCCLYGFSLSDLG